MPGVKQFMKADTYFVNIEEEERGKSVENTYLLFRGVEGKHPILLCKPNIEGGEVKLMLPSVRLAKDFEDTLSGKAAPKRCNIKETAEVDDPDEEDDTPPRRHILETSEIPEENED